MKPPAAIKPAVIKQDIAARARALGFASVGFARAELAPHHRAHLQDFVQAGCHGGMDWLAARIDQRSQPQALWPEVRTVISLGYSYAPAEDPLANLAAPGVGNISVYARCYDYHDVVRSPLKHLAQHIAARYRADVKVFADTAPVMEKPLAQAAGLGWAGKHTNLVSRRHGSWLFLAEIYTTLDLPEDSPHADRCGTCQRCLDICPTSAFIGPYKLDARRCISYLTIEHRGPIPEDLRPLLGNRIYGCDDCLAVCPWNRFATPCPDPRLTPRADLLAPLLADLATLDDAAFRARFARSPIKRIGRNRFLRNVLYAIGNSGLPALAQAAAPHRADPDPAVADAAAWALKRLTLPAPPRNQSPLIQQEADRP